MAHSLSAQKRVRQTEKRRARNRARKEVVKTQTKAVLAAVGKGSASEAETALKTLVSTMDRVKFKSTIHKNTAARKRSRLAKKVNAIKKAGAGKKK